MRNINEIIINGVGLKGLSAQKPISVSGMEKKLCDCKIAVDGHRGQYFVPS